MPLPDIKAKDKSFYFWDVTDRSGKTRGKKVSVKRDDVKLVKKKNTSKYGPDYNLFLRAKGANSTGGDLNRFISESDYAMLKKAFAQKASKKSPAKSAKKSAAKSKAKTPSRCNRVGSKRKTKSMCKGKTCQWVPAKYSKKRNGSRKLTRKSYCRRIPTSKR
tara:strand:+ start:368 stop:853 length:486 start_codon:yes stop_codon:yes gene_type:complete